MNRIPPWQQIRQEISSLLSEGIRGEVNILTEWVKKGVRTFCRKPFGQEVTDHLGRGYYERRKEEEPHRGYRSGYELKRVKTSEGRVELMVPQPRENLEPYRSKVLPLIFRKSPLLEHLVQEMYARGLFRLRRIRLSRTTRDIEDLFKDS